jgi:hypothetical protein
MRERKYSGGRWKTLTGFATRVLQPEDSGEAGKCHYPYFVADSCHAASRLCGCVVSDGRTEGRKVTPRIGPNPISRHPQPYRHSPPESMQVYANENLFTCCDRFFVPFHPRFLLMLAYCDDWRHAVIYQPHPGGSFTSELGYQRITQLWRKNPVKQFRVCICLSGTSLPEPRVGSSLCPRALNCSLYAAIAYCRECAVALLIRPTGLR